MESYLCKLFVGKRWALCLVFKPWYRISESEKETPLDPRGDDNPDIYKYMGLL